METDKSIGEIKMAVDWVVETVADEAALEVKLNQLRDRGKNIKHILYNGTDDTFVITYLETA